MKSLLMLETGPALMSKEGQISEDKNTSFFIEHHDDYKSKVARLETYQNIFKEVSAAIEGANILVDIGNGGVFDYDTGRAQHIIAVDLMFTANFTGTMPPNGEAMHGSALDLPIEADHADTVLMNMLLHHLTGPSVDATQQNLSRALGEAVRVLRPGGKIVIMESCVPPWFFEFEKAVYKTAVKIIQRMLEHPPTLQFPAHVVEKLLCSICDRVNVRRIPRGIWVLQYGKMWPSVLTPAQPYLFTAFKR